ncbi:hypothetical protein [Streptomyces parvus]|uniref:hypothetical protein n=1 Tax=Streptomyces parvus TaxID=66428 RepID=UPI003D73DB7F
MSISVRRPASAAGAAAHLTYRASSPRAEPTVPSIPRQEPQDLLDDDGRWRLLPRCLADDALPTDVRAGGAITLLFGPSTERLCHLTPEHLKFGDKHAHLVLGHHPVLLPPRLAQLLRCLAEQPELRPQLSRVRPGPRWLFPGMVPGKPISTHGMTQKLHRTAFRFAPRATERWPPSLPISPARSSPT